MPAELCLALQVVGSWTGDAHVTAATLWLAPGKYLLQLSLDAELCSLDIDAGGGLPEEATWKLQVAPSADVKACALVADDSKQKYFQVGRDLVAASPEGSREGLCDTTRQEKLRVSKQKCFICEQHAATPALGMNAKVLCDGAAPCTWCLFAS